MEAHNRSFVYGSKNVGSGGNGISKHLWETIYGTTFRNPFFLTLKITLICRLTKLHQIGMVEEYIIAFISWQSKYII